jgi:hypothetical protein
MRNTGEFPLVITALSATAPWTVALSGTSTLPITIPAPTSAGVVSTVDLTVTLGDSTYGNVIPQGTLTITSNDPGEPNAMITLSGYGGLEPSLQSLINSVFGYQTVILKPGQSIDTHGAPTLVGDEVINIYWNAAFPGRPVQVREIASFETSQINPFSWIPESQVNLPAAQLPAPLFSSSKYDTFTLFPFLTGTTTYAAGQFTPSEPFEFKVTNDWSDDTKNIPARTGDLAHRHRFFPLKDLSGNLVPETYILADDYGGSAYDYNDNVYIISNIVPAPETQ